AVRPKFLWEPSLLPENRLTSWHIKRWRQPPFSLSRHPPAATGSSDFHRPYRAQFPPPHVAVPRSGGKDAIRYYDPASRHPTDEAFPHPPLPPVSDATRASIRKGKAPRPPAAAEPVPLPPYLSGNEDSTWPVLGPAGGSVIAASV